LFVKYITRSRRYGKVVLRLKIEARKCQMNPCSRNGKGMNKFVQPLEVYIAPPGEEVIANAEVLGYYDETGGQIGRQPQPEPEFIDVAQLHPPDDAVLNPTTSPRPERSRRGFGAVTRTTAVAATLALAATGCTQKKNVVLAGRHAPAASAPAKASPSGPTFDPNKPFIKRDSCKVMTSAEVLGSLGMRSPSGVFECSPASDPDGEGAEWSGDAPLVVGFSVLNNVPGLPPLEGDKVKVAGTDGVWLYGGSHGTLEVQWGSRRIDMTLQEAYGTPDGATPAEESTKLRNFMLPFANTLLLRLQGASHENSAASHNPDASQTSDTPHTSAPDEPESPYPSISGYQPRVE
jgi:hypothetical protein